MATREELDKIKELDLMDLVMDSGLKYKHEHDHLKLSCLFHDEHTPSLAVYSDHYFCYACGVDGDIFEFAQKIYDITFTEAVKVLMDYDKEKEIKQIN